MPRKIRRAANFQADLVDLLDAQSGKKPQLPKQFCDTDKEAKRFHRETRRLILEDALEKAGAPYHDLSVHMMRVANVNLDEETPIPEIVALMTRKSTAQTERDAADEATAEAESTAEPISLDWRAIIADRLESDDYSFNALGIDAGVSPSVVMRFIKGERDITVATAQKLCDVLDLVLVPREDVVSRIG